MKTIEAEPKQLLLSLVLRITLDPWFLMLALGGISDRLDKPFLAIDFLTSILICIAVQAVTSAGNVTKWIVED